MRCTRALQNICRKLSEKFVLVPESLRFMHVSVFNNPKECVCDGDTMLGFQNYVGTKINFF